MLVLIAHTHTNSLVVLCVSPFGQKHFYVVMGVIKSEMDVSDLCKCLVYYKAPHHHYY